MATYPVLPGGTPTQLAGQGCGDDWGSHKPPVVPTIGAKAHSVGGCDCRRASRKCSSTARWVLKFSGIPLSCRGCVDQLVACRWRSEEFVPLPWGTAVGGAGWSAPYTAFKREGVRVDVLSQPPRPLTLDEDLVGQGVQVVVDRGWGRGSGAGGGEEYPHGVTAGRCAVRRGPCVRGGGWCRCSYREAWIPYRHVPHARLPPRVEVHRVSSALVQRNFGPETHARLLDADVSEGVRTVVAWHAGPSPVDPGQVIGHRTDLGMRLA